MNRKRTSAAKATLADMPFSKLLETDQELAEMRREYACQPSDERRNAADWEYDSACASDMLDQALGQRVVTGDALGAWRGYVAALAIDPDHGPAMLTVGAIEYQLGRVDDAMAVLLRLPGLAHDDSLPEIIDKAGDFLIDQDDLANAELLYAAAAEVHPEVAIYHIGLGYCAGENGRFDDAVKHTRRAVELEPDNYRHLSDFGFSLTQAGQYDEAEQILLRAMKLAPPDYDMAKGNLDHLYHVWD
jgi:tetratricopeptide (TPR) repeat protein